MQFACHFFPCDHTNAADCLACVRHVVLTHGRINVLYNNAGLVECGLLEETSEVDVVRLLETNVVAAWRMCRYVVPLMAALSPTGSEGVCDADAAAARASALARLSAGGLSTDDTLRALADVVAGNAVRLPLAAPHGSAVFRLLAPERACAVVNCASDWGVTGAPGACAYCMTKGAVSLTPPSTRDSLLLDAALRHRFFFRPLIFRSFVLLFLRFFIPSFFCSFVFLFFRFFIHSYFSYLLFAFVSPCCVVTLCAD